MAHKMSDKHNTKRRVADMIAAMMRGPASAMQIARLTGYSYANVQVWIDYFHDRGLCYVHSWEVKRVDKACNLKSFARIFKWCEGDPYSQPDAPKPMSAWLPKGVTAPARARYEKICEWMVANPGKTQAQIANHFNLSIATVSRAQRWRQVKMREEAKAQTLAALSKRRTV